MNIKTMSMILIHIYILYGKNIHDEEPNKGFAIFLQTLNFGGFGLNAKIHSQLLIQTFQQ